MNNIKIFAKNENEQETLIQTIRISIQHIGITFVIEKCAMLIMKKGKRETTKGIELSTQKSIRKLEEKENYKYFGVLEADSIKRAEIKEKVRKEYFRRRRRGKISRNQTLLKKSPCAVSLVRNIGSFLKMDNEETQTNEPKNKVINDDAQRLAP